MSLALVASDGNCWQNNTGLNDALPEQDAATNAGIRPCVSGNTIVGEAETDVRGARSAGGTESGVQQKGQF